MNAALPDGGRHIATYTVEHVDGVMLLRLAGELGMATVPELQTGLDAATARNNSPVIVDLTAVQFLSSTGLRLLVALHTDLTAQDRSLRVVVGEGRFIPRTLQITGLNQVLNLDPNLPTALGAIRRNSGAG